MSKRCRKSNDCCKMEQCGCPTPRMCCSSMAVPTTAYQMVSVPQLVYDNVPASPCGVPSYGGSYGGSYGCSNTGIGNCSSGQGGSWIIIIILLLCFCGGNGFGGNCNDGCGDSFGGSWIIIIILLLCCCGGGGGFGC